jgi:hypothetical protein
MASGLTLDCGALIAHEKGDRRLQILMDEAVGRGATITLPSAVLAQAWRGNAPRIARLLRACVVEPLDGERARQVGMLLAESHTSDVIDAVVVESAFRRLDSIVTSDPGDITRLIAALARLPGPMPAPPLTRRMKVLRV